MPSAMNERTVAELEKLLRYIAANLKQRGREILTNYPITPPQFVALQWLLEEGDLTVGELSNKMYLACSTTTDLVDRMERNGLVARVRDEHDRRVVRIHLLEKGERIIEEVIEKRQRDLASVLESFSDEEIVVFERCLRKLHQEMTKE
ncbi:MarR family transcriptional regulator [Geobacillus sp. BMUD]|uniref:MarR family transcriptional regulator n=1 Tax=Geobacillus proteiniphilus TaxID=860353 RepID=A0A1Q5TAH1_9BACL|nr:MULTISPECIES: MarR family transcriptional regulator [Geobacillus]NNU83196.1 MarR family transcriptional regulator [Geobacillus sp. BMUD]OKO97181.1 Transcriptional regulator, MarR family [Geobacillus proteiniphilus]WMJ16958.1 MarR family transcriptional regulator [Geobacillus proteiniphilus]